MSRRSMLSRFFTVAFKSSTTGCTFCLRLKRSSCRVNPVARFADCRSSSAYWIERTVRVEIRRDHLAVADDDARMLLKSCATPPANWPMASIFCAWRICASSCFSRVTSRLTAT